MAADRADDRVLPVTRGLAAFIVPFLVVAFVALYGWPGDTDRFFAWPVKPPLTAMLLASVYLGGAYFFVRATTARRWHTVKLGFPPVATFASLLGIATIVHWGRFTHDRVAFWLWAGLYFTTPFLVAGTYLANRRHDSRPGPADLLVGRRTALAIAGVGLLATLTSAALFLQPNRMIDVWPWALTPLTARVLAAMFALGSAGLGVAGERRWSAVRLMVQVEIVMLALIAGAAVRGRAAVDAGSAWTWVLAVGLAAVFVGSVVGYVRMEHRAPSSAPVRRAGARLA